MADSAAERFDRLKAGEEVSFTHAEVAAMGVPSRPIPRGLAARWWGMVRVVTAAIGRRPRRLWRYAWDREFDALLSAANARTGTSDNERAELGLVHFDDAHDGPGWYLYYVDYPDEGSIGAFKTREEAVAWVEKNSSDHYLGGDHAGH